MKLHKHIKDRISNNIKKAFQSKQTLSVNDKKQQKTCSKQLSCYHFASRHRRPYVLKNLLVAWEISHFFKNVRLLTRPRNFSKHTVFGGVKRSDNMAVASSIFIVVYCCFLVEFACLERLSCYYCLFCLLCVCVASFRIFFSICLSCFI